MKYYIETTLHTDYESAIAKTKEVLKSEGFGVLSTIAIDEKFNEKLNIDFRNYTILGACNPPLAYEALQHEDKIGTLLPCNVIVQELDDNSVEIAAIDPVASMAAIENPEVAKLAETVKGKLTSAINALR